jgi:hypothetical protein
MEMARFVVHRVIAATRDSMLTAIGLCRKAFRDRWDYSVRIKGGIDAIDARGGRMVI